MQIQRIRFCFGGKEADYQWYELRCSTLKDAQGEIMLAGIMQNIQISVVPCQPIVHNYHQIQEHLPEYSKVKFSRHS